MDLRQYLRFSLKDLFLLMIFSSGLFAVDAYHRRIEAKYRQALEMSHETLVKINASDEDIRQGFLRMKAEIAYLRTENKRLLERLKRDEQE